MTKIKNTKEFTPGIVPFSGALDSDPITLNGDVMRLFVFCCTGIKKNNKEKVKVKILELDRYFNRDGKKVDEGSADDTIGEFEGFLENKEEKFIFSEMKPVKEIDWLKTAPYPYFRITFAGEKDTIKNKSDNSTTSPTFPVIIGKNDETPESPEFEIGFLIEKEDGTFLGGSGPTVSYFTGQHSYAPILNLFDIHTQLASVNLLNITNAQIKYSLEDDDTDEIILQASVASTTSVYDATISAYNEKKMKAVNAALKEIGILIKSSRNPYFQNIQAVNDYYEKLEQYKGQTEQYQKMQKSAFSHTGDCYAMENSIIRPMAIKLNKIENDIHQYLKTSNKPPKEYLDRIERNIAIITRNDTINEILNNPLVRMVGLLPGAGVVTGTLKVIKGDAIGGFIDIFGSIVTYGSFLKLARVAQAYRKSTQSTTELLFSSRYRKLVSSITSAKALDKLVETGLRQANLNVGILFEAVGKFRSIKGHVDSIAILHRNRNYILDMTQKAIAGINGGLIKDAGDYISFLGRLENTNATLEFFAHLRILHATVKGGRDTYKITIDAMDDVNELLGFEDIPGVKEFDPEITQKIAKLFILMRDKKFEIDLVINATTLNFPTNTSIIEYFNKELEQYDMFGLKLNADIRYENSREEMLLALDSIEQKWDAEKRNRDNWIEANKSKYIHSDLCMLRSEWARTKKSNGSVDLTEALETCIANVIEKIKGQIEQREALSGESELSFLVERAREYTVPGTKMIYDFNISFFKSHAENLIKKYY
jgi:hypothetical protein